MLARQRCRCHVLAGAFLLLLFPLSGWASLAGISPEVIGERIDHIRVSGNAKTQERYLLHWACWGISLA